VRDCAVHQPLALEQAPAGEHGRRHFDAEVSAAGDCGPSFLNLLLEGLAQRVDEGTLEVAWMVVFFMWQYRGLR
jgi:hypothetical protein